MPKRIILIFIFILFIVFLTACNNDEPLPTEPNEPTPPIVIEKEIRSVVGLDNITITQNDYFHPLDGVTVLNESDQEISHLFEITGHVPYGVTGDYPLTYTLSYGDSNISQTRTISVVAGTINRPSNPRNSLSGTQIVEESGSYRINSASDIAHPTSPQRIASDLLDMAVPSNGWWTSLLVSNYGGGNGIYTNPL